MSSTQKVLKSISGNVAKIQLNNPRALHALDLDIVQALNGIFLELSRKNMKTIIVSSSTCGYNLNQDDLNKEKKKPPKASFCAGGDIKSMYQAAMGLNGCEADVEGRKLLKHGYGCPSLLSGKFFHEGNNLIHKVATQPDDVPQVSIWDGIVMGGGLGLTVPGKYKIATENSISAMPETKIG